MSTSQKSNKELCNLLEDYYIDDMEEFFKVVRDNNLSFENDYIVNKEGEEIYYLGLGCTFVVECFYDYWLEHNNSSPNNSRFIDLRC